MKRSTDRILVTHVGSLVRPMSIRNILSAREHGQPYDEAAYKKILREEVDRRRSQAGGRRRGHSQRWRIRQSRMDPLRLRALGGFIHRPIRPGDREQNPIYLIREAQKFPEFYAAYTPIQYYDWLPPGQSNTPLKADPPRFAQEPLGLGVRRTDHLQGAAAIRQDIDNFKSALKGVQGDGRVHAGRRADERARAVA